MSEHLRTQQFNDLILGIAEAEPAAHLAACPQCRAEMETLRATLSEFRGAALRWSENAAQQTAVPKKQPSSRRWAKPAWALVAVAIVLAAVLPLTQWRSHSSRSAAADAAQAQIVRDNQLLAQIDSETAETTPAPLQPLQVNSK
jgi:anti-sigma factor RsiW